MKKTKFNIESYYRTQVYAAARAINAYTKYFEKILDCYNTEGHHKFIPAYYTRIIIICLKLVYDHLATKHGAEGPRPFQFIDCGCGVGNILLLARESAGYKVTGLEYEPEIFEIAKLLVPNGTILNQDILTYDNYKLYDVIYYHIPLSDEDKTDQFINKIHKDMKIGAIVVICDGKPLRMEKDERFENIFTKFTMMPHALAHMAWEKRMC